ncbi:non-ribosomal peptide synthetase [Kordia jejudonensis]|uniref:non-ribosomal peptide synthetase n=1 Tax=Kordia jejudonensis TaxID=1348245 RepID=UPI00062957E7|nr:non-ribosomal peptide synthetase [Kordia jejudonensis]
MKLTLPQYDVYYEQLLYPNDPIYNIGAKIKIEGTIDTETFQKAYDGLIRQHDAYRTLFKETNGVVEATVVSQEKYTLTCIDFSTKENADEVANTFMQEQFVKPFQFTGTSFLHTFILIKVHEELHYLFSVYHHIITDGWGTSLMFQRLVKNYNEILETGKITSEYPFTYEDFVTNDAEYERSEAFEADKNYWKTKFSNLPENLFQKKNPHQNIHKSSRESLKITRTTYDELAELAKQYRASTFHAILAILYVYFGRKKQNKDFAIGLPVLNRSKSIFKKTVGLFMGVSPLRIQLDFEETFEALIVNIKNQLRQDYRHQRLPLGKLIQTLGIFDEKEKIFNITLSYEKQNYSHNFGTTKTTVIPLTHQSERVALAIYIREFDEKEDVTIDFDYNINYFDADSIQHVTTHFETLLHDLLKNPSNTLKNINYLPKAEQEKLLVDFNSTTVDYPKDHTFLELFQTQVDKLKDKIAVYDSKSEYSYLELDQKSDQIAAYIHSLKEATNVTAIGVLAERSTELIAILLGIMKAGKAYIPLDPTFPEERLQYIIDHSQLDVLISDQPDHFLQSSTHKTLTTAQLFEACVHEIPVDVVNIPKYETAYIIYTSGSTGNPKGVEIGHASLLNFLVSMQKSPGIHMIDTVCSVTTYSFDISILEFFVPLISGATLYMANRDTLASPDSIINMLKKVAPSIIQATPSFYQSLFNAGWSGSKDLKILCGGDALSKNLAATLLEKCDEVWNMYGPTETTIWSSIKQLETAEDAGNIGKPIANTHFYILDNDLQLLPVGTFGNVYIGGDGLALGYYKNEELTNEKFIKNPFGNGRIYETGDVGYWTATGEIIFGGRNDNQVKIRGYRIELEDVESKLNSLSTVKQAIVVPKQNNDQEAFLAAFIIPTTDTFQIETCRNELQKKLPSYMIPSLFTTLETFPMTLNKKVDRKALIQAKTISTTTEKEQQTELTALQKQIRTFWRETLHYEGNIHIDDNYFTLGGHSLNAVKLVYAINTNLSYSISLKTIFENPTITSLANYLETHASKSTENQNIPKAIKKVKYPVTASQHAIWLASQYSAVSIAYNMVAGFNVQGDLNAERIQKAMERLIQKHEILRTNFIEENGNVFQTITPENQHHFSVKIIEDESVESSEVIENFIHAEFNLATDCLLKLLLIKEHNNIVKMIFCSHHISIDGWSLALLTHDFIQEYTAVGHAENPAERLQFKDYSEWTLSNTNTEQCNTFWKNYLANYQPKESFRADFHPENNTHKGDQYAINISQAETNTMLEFVQQQQTTMHNFLATALHILIYKLSHHTDILIGTVNAGRNHPATENILGMFVKTMPLRLQLAATDTFEKTLQNVQNAMLQLDEFQNNSTAQQHALFDVLIAFQNTDFSYKETIFIEKSELTAFPIDVKYSRLPLLFNFAIIDKILHLQLSYNTEKYTQDTIQWIWLKYQKLINQLIHNPIQQLSEIEIPLPFESEDVVDIDFNF